MAIEPRSAPQRVTTPAAYMGAISKPIIFALLVLGPIGHQSTGSEVKPERSSTLNGRHLLAQYGGAVVSVECDVTAMISVNGRAMPPRSQSREVHGTIVAASGLTVISLASMDPSVSPAGAPNMRVEQVEFSNIRVYFANGSVFPARIAFRRDDLDLAFLAPEVDPGAKGEFTPVPLDHAAEPAILDVCHELSRAPKAQARIAMIRSVEVAGVFHKEGNSPGYILTGQPVLPGCPVFGTQGNIVGIGARFVAAGATAPGILPANDILAAINAATGITGLTAVESNWEPP